MAASPSRSAVLGLYRQFLVAGRSVSDYNVRAYAARRARLGFVQNSELPTGSPELAAAFAKGKLQLAMLQRQALIGNMFPSDKSVMDAGDAR